MCCRCNFSLQLLFSGESGREEKTEETRENVRNVLRCHSYSAVYLGIQILLFSQDRGRFLSCPDSPPKLNWIIPSSGEGFLFLQVLRSSLQTVSKQYRVLVSDRPSSTAYFLRKARVESSDRPQFCIRSESTLLTLIRA